MICLSSLPVELRLAIWDYTGLYVLSARPKASTKLRGIHPKASYLIYISDIVSVGAYAVYALGGRGKGAQQLTHCAGINNEMIAVGWRDGAPKLFWLDPPNPACHGPYIFRVKIV